jgi:ribulose-phosphate 3-epimerase
MVEDPLALLPALADAGTDVVFFHLEATRSPIRVARSIAALGMTPGVAINPGTPLPDVTELLELSHVLIMAVEPGFAAQAWIPSSVARVRRLRDAVGPETTIHVDGHVDVETLPALWDAGAIGFVCGTSGLFTGPGADYAAELTRLRSAVTAATPRAAATATGRPFER